MFDLFLDFDIKDIEDGYVENDILFLVDIGVFEDVFVEVGDVYCGEYRDSVNDDGLEEEFVVVYVFEEGKFGFGIGV